MRDKSESSGTDEKKSAAVIEADYSPRQHSLGDQVRFCLKVIAAGAIALLIFWLME